MSPAGHAPHVPGDAADGAPRASIPADIDAPDRIVWGLTFRQLAILAGAAAAGYGLWRAAGRALPGLPPGVLLAAATPLAAAAVTVALGRRDGRPLDAWLASAVAMRRVPRRQAPGGPADPAALLAGFGRWLNSLTAPAQIVVSTARVDLRPHAAAVRDGAPLLPHPALARAAADHADFLDGLATARDPLRRHVLVVVHADGDVLATRRGQDTARALAALGVDARVLDGPAVTAALAAAVDPYAPPAPGPRATADAVITAAATTAHTSADRSTPWR